MLRSKVVLGVFKLDLGAVYDQPMHAFVNKWLALTALDEDAGGVMGESHGLSGSHGDGRSHWVMSESYGVSGSHGVTVSGSHGDGRSHWVMSESYGVIGSHVVGGVT